MGGGLSAEKKGVFWRGYGVYFFHVGIWVLEPRRRVFLTAGHESYITEFMGVLCSTVGCFAHLIN